MATNGHYALALNLSVDLQEEDLRFLISHKRERRRLLLKEPIDSKSTVFMKDEDQPPSHTKTEK